ncbi:MAG: glycosyltransferase family 39 protein [Chloroflexi bacterium]|nr:glycosyltransferase family 39 protein [Chloroflexota bacterium]
MKSVKSSTRYSTATTLAVMALLLVSFGLRLYRLDFQSFWSDEGISLQRSAQPFGQLLRSMPVEHLPGYFVLLHFWLAIAGDNDFAMRFLSVWPSVLAIAMAYRLALELGNRPAGLVTVLLLATNAFQVWYAQEARTYSWLLLLGLVASWCLWHLLVAQGKHQTAFLVGYILAITAAVYAHFYGFLIPMAHTIFALGWLLVKRDWRALFRWALGGVVVVLAFLPWLPRALGIFSYKGWRDPIDPWQIPWRALMTYTVGETMPLPWQDWLPWLYLALALIGIGLWWRVRPAASLFLTTLVLIPLGFVFGLALVHPDFHERYTIMASGPLLLLIAGGLAAASPFVAQWLTAQNKFVVLWRLLALTLVVGFVVTNRLALAQLYTNPALQKPDYRAAAAYIQQLQQPGDVIVTDGIDPNIVFKHYYKGGLPLYDLRFLLDANHQAVDQALVERTAKATRVWEVLFFHEPDKVQVWLATHGWAAPANFFNGIRVTLYGLPDQAAKVQTFQLAFGPALTLVQASVPARAVQRNQLARITTEWQVSQPAQDFKFSLRLQNANGQVVYTQDYVPQNWFAPTRVWIVGQSATDQRGLLVPADLPTGQYQVTLRLYDPATGTAVDTSAGQDVPLGLLEVSD